MREKRIDVNLTISRDSDDVMRISVQDEMSRETFLNIRMSPADLMRTITGLAFSKCIAVVHGLEHVGKRKIIEKRTAQCPHNTYDKKMLAEWLLLNCNEEGWEIDPYLGSQGSVSFGIQGVTLLNYSVFRYE